MSSILHSLWSWAFLVLTIAGIALQKVALDRFLFNPIENWWAGVRAGREYLLDRMAMRRWDGTHPVHLSRKDRAWALWGSLVWRWSKEAKERREEWSNIPRPPRDLRGCNF